MKDILKAEDTGRSECWHIGGPLLPRFLAKVFTCVIVFDPRQTLALIRVHCRRTKGIFTRVKIQNISRKSVF